MFDLEAFQACSLMWLRALLGWHSVAPRMQNFGNQVPTVSTKKPHSVKEVRRGSDRGDSWFCFLFVYWGPGTEAGRKDGQYPLLTRPVLGFLLLQSSVYIYCFLFRLSPISQMPGFRCALQIWRGWVSPFQLRLLAAKLRFRPSILTALGSQH